MFDLMINDLDTKITMSDAVAKRGHTQAIADRVIEWSCENRIQLNTNKNKELTIFYAKEQSLILPSKKGKK